MNNGIYQIEWYCDPCGIYRDEHHEGFEELPAKPTPCPHCGDLMPVIADVQLSHRHKARRCTRCDKLHTHNGDAPWCVECGILLANKALAEEGVIHG